jgi:uncharacterized protein YndB with AHSA1/START domain
MNSISSLKSISISVAAFMGVFLPLQRVAAEVLNVAPNGFETHLTLHVAASPDKAYAAALNPAQWWASDHTFSQNAANLKLDAQVGGCWCETLPGGGAVEHMRVLYLAPGKALRLRGALGPFQALAVDGVLTFTFKAAAQGSDVTLTYVLGGYSKDGFESLSKAADQVLTEQMARYKKLLDGQ